MKATMQEIDQVLSTLAHLYGPAFDDTTRRVIAEIKSNIRGTKPDDRPYIFLDHNEDVTGLEYLNELADAILNHHVLKIRYQRFHTSVAEEIIFHPYCIKEYNYRWFVLGYHENQQVWNWVLALDRIKSIEREDKISFRRRDQDWKAYFEELIGVTWPEDEKPEQVIIVFSKEFSPYIETKPLHPSQKKRWLPDGRMEVRIRVILNYELENLILSFGQHAQVIAPERLKNRIQERLQQALKQYGSV
ncbi:helix-turn-helix transcriptional regulator [Thermoflavifilum thermophilum]|nr:WYL domain-containing protein [Thermoflavifilum thermophilum]